MGSLSARQTIEEVAATFARRFGIKVVFEGSGAYSTSDTIILPRISLENVEQERMIYGLLVHEAAHIKYSDFRAFTGVSGALLKELVNILEDTRIESLMCRDYMGAYENLAWVNETIYSRLEPMVDNAPACPKLNIIKAYIHTRASHLVMDYPGSGSLAWRFYRELTCLVSQQGLYDLNELIREVPACKDISDVIALSRRIYDLLGSEYFFVPDFLRMALRCQLCSQFDLENYRRLAELFGQEFKAPVLCPAPVHLQVESCQSVISRMGLSLDENEVNNGFVPDFLSPFLPEFFASGNLNDTLMAARFSAQQLEDATALSTMAAGNLTEARWLARTADIDRPLKKPAPALLKERLERCAHGDMPVLQQKLTKAILKDLHTMPDIPAALSEQPAGEVSRTDKVFNPDTARAASGADGTASWATGAGAALASAAAGAAANGAADTDAAAGAAAGAAGSAADGGGARRAAVEHGTFIDEGPDVHPETLAVGPEYRALECVQDYTVRGSSNHTLPLSFQERFVSGQLEILERSEGDCRDPEDFSSPYLYAGPLARPDIPELHTRINRLMSTALHGTEGEQQKAREAMPGLSDEQYRNIIQVCESTDHLDCHLRPLDLRHNAFTGPLCSWQELCQALITMSRFLRDHEDEALSAAAPGRLEDLKSFMAIPHERFLELCGDRDLVDVSYLTGSLKLRAVCPSLELIARLSMEMASRPYDRLHLAPVLDLSTAGAPVQLLNGMRSWQAGMSRHMKIAAEDVLPEARSREELDDINRRAFTNYDDLSKIVKARIMTPTMIENSRRIRDEGICLPVFQYDQGQKEIDCLGWSSFDGNLDLSSLPQHRRSLMDRTYEVRRHARYRRSAAVLGEYGLYSRDILDPDLISDPAMYCRDRRGNIYYKYYYERTLVARRVMLSCGLQRADAPAADAASAGVANKTASVGVADKVAVAAAASGSGASPGRYPVACAVARDHFSAINSYEYADHNAMERNRSARALYEGRRQPLVYRGFYLSELFTKPSSGRSYINPEAYDPLTGLRHPVYIEPESMVYTEWQRHTRMTSALRQLLPWELQLAHMELSQKQRPLFNMRDPRLENSFADALREYYYVIYRLADTRSEFLGRTVSGRSAPGGTYAGGGNGAGRCAPQSGRGRASGSASGGPAGAVRNSTAFKGQTFTSESDADVIRDLKNLRYDLRLELMANIDRMRAQGSSLVRVIDWQVMNNPQLNNHGLHSGLMQDIQKAQQYLVNSAATIEHSLVPALSSAIESLTGNHKGASRHGSDLNVRRAQFMPLGEQRIFRADQEVFGHDLSVHLLVDISLSMREGQKGPPTMKFVCPDSAGFMACQAALALARALSRTEGTSCEATFFPGPFEGSSCLNVKRADEDINAVERFFFQLPRLGTPTAQAIMYAMHSLLRRDARRRVILLITDGLPDDSAAAVHALNTARARGVQVLCTGILKTTEEFKQQARQIFPDMVTVENLNDLPATVSRLLLDYTAAYR